MELNHGASMTIGLAFSKKLKPLCSTQYSFSKRLKPLNIHALKKESKLKIQFEVEDEYGLCFVVRRSCELNLEHLSLVVSLFCLELGGQWL